MLMQSFATHLRFHKSKKCFTKLCTKARFNRSHTQADCKGSPLTATLGLEHPMACANAKLLDPCFKMGRRDHQPTHDRDVNRASKSTLYTLCKSPRI